jgi:exopolysaccharide biosynthesis polyprenyl glycosylphosphotransferase
MLRRFSINFALFSMLLDALVVFGSMVAMSYFRITLNKLPFIAYLPADTEYPIFLYIVFPLVWVGVLAGFSIYDGKKFFKMVDEFSVLTIASIVGTIAEAGVLYLSYRDFSRALFILIIIASFLACAVWRMIARLVFRFRKETLNLNRNVLVIGLGSDVGKITKLFKSGSKEIVQTVVSLDLTGNFNTFKEIPDQCPRTISAIRNAVKENQSTDVVIAFPRTHSSWIGPITSHLEDLPLGVWVALDFFDLSMADTRVESLAGLPLMDLRAPALDEYERILKRSFDLFVSSIALILFSPILLLVILLILFFDGWPVFFMQKRIGENGRVFNIIKFRTMVRDAEKMQPQIDQVDKSGNVIHKLRGDPRVTWLGRILRRLSLDELPQIFNVFRGEMSLVGPRPELPYLAQNYQHWQRRRLSVPPGITGWWQVNGRSDRVMHLHTEDDIYYVENYSIWLDLQIIIRTVWAVLVGKGSF